jgi:hypothetical protein
MHSGFRSRRPWRVCRFIQLSNNAGRRTPTRVADGHACSRDKYGIGVNSTLRMLLRMQGKIVVTDKVASAGGAQMCGNGVSAQPRKNVDRKKEARHALYPAVFSPLKGIRVLSPLKGIRVLSPLKGIRGPGRVRCHAVEARMMQQVLSP